ncbi:MAG: MFS transporter [Firmicutes bacterium]|nr:MFS transporter [Bacillota bacterium]
MEEKKAKRTLGLGTLLAYGVGSLLGDSPYANLIAYQVLFYLTDVLMVNTYLAATVYSGVQWIKFLTMAIAGVIIDAKALRWGRYRSWCFVGALLVCTVPLTYANFGFKSVAVVITVYLITLVINQIGYNLAWSAQRTLPIKMGKNTADIIALNAFSGAGMSGGAVIYSAFFSFAAARFTGGTEFTVLAALCAGFMMLCTLLLMAISKKYDPPTPVEQFKNETKEKKDTVTFGQMIKSLKGPTLVYFISYVLSNSKDGFFYALLAYFTTHVLNNPDAYALSISAASVLGVIGSFIQIPLVNFLGKKRDFFFTHIALAVIFFLIRYIGGNATIFIILRGLVGFVGGLSGGLMGAFAVDLADYNEMKTGSSAKAFLQSVGGMTVRVGAILSTTISGFALASSGYVAGQELTPKILSSIFNWMAFGPGVCCLLSVLAFTFYKVDERELDAWRASRKNAEAAPAEE